MPLVRSIVVKIPLLFITFGPSFKYVFNDFLVWFVGGLRDALTNIS